MLDTEQGSVNKNKKKQAGTPHYYGDYKDYKIELLGIVYLAVYKHFKETKY